MGNHCCRNRDIIPYNCGDLTGSWREVKDANDRSSKDISLSIVPRGQITCVLGDARFHTPGYGFNRNGSVIEFETSAIWDLLVCHPAHHFRCVMTSDSQMLLTVDGVIADVQMEKLS